VFTHSKGKDMIDQSVHEYGSCRWKHMKDFSANLTFQKSKLTCWKEQL